MVLNETSADDEPTGLQERHDNDSSDNDVESQPPLGFVIPAFCTRFNSDFNRQTTKYSLLRKNRDKIVRTRIHHWPRHAVVIFLAKTLRNRRKLKKKRERTNKHKIYQMFNCFINNSKKKKSLGLVNRGANGALCCIDIRILEESDQKVNVTGTISPQIPRKNDCQLYLSWIHQYSRIENIHPFLHSAPRPRCQGQPRVCLGWGKAVHQDAIGANLPNDLWEWIEFSITVLSYSG